MPPEPGPLSSDVGLLRTNYNDDILPRMLSATVVLPTTSAGELAEELRDGGEQLLAGHGSRSHGIALDACRIAGGVFVQDPTGFSRQVHPRVIKTDRTLVRRGRRTQPWLLVVRPIVSTEGLPPGEMIVEDGAARWYVYV